MKLTTPQQAALTSALAHPCSVITAAPKTATALQRRGLVVGRKLTKAGLAEARSIGSAFQHCDKCGNLFGTMKTLSSLGKDFCPACLKEIAEPVMRTLSIVEQRAEWSRKGKILDRMKALGMEPDARVRRLYQ